MQIEYPEQSPPQHQEAPINITPEYTSEEEIKNIVGQIDPQRILDNFNHSLKGEYYSKEEGEWKKIGDELVNTACRGWVISYMTSLMNNASTMGIIQEKQLSFLMEGVIKTVTREFRCNLEKFGFVPPGKYYDKKVFENKGTPDTARMDSVAEMIYQRALLIFTRSLKGTESQRVFKSLHMTDQLQFLPQQKKGFIRSMFNPS